jgi:hypothetical protein
MTPEETLWQIENLMERWLQARDNDDETLEAIKKLIMDEGYLGWFKTNVK